VTLILDAGALVAIDRFDRRVQALLTVARDAGIPVSTSAGVVAQVWRNGSRQANLARMLAGAYTAPLDPTTARRLGLLLGATGSADVVGAHIAWLAKDGDHVLTSDPGHIGQLLATRKVRASITTV
jgi:hypothetical protein